MIRTLLIFLTLADGATAAPTCATQPSDAEKIRFAVAFFLSNRPNHAPFAYVDGRLISVEGGLWTDPDAAIAAQPDCCRLAYEDAETFKAPALKARLDDDFGGFAYVAFDTLSEYDGSLRVARSFESYVLNSCGHPVVVMSDD